MAIFNLDKITVPLGRAAKFGTMVVEPERFEPHIHDYIYEYGLRQVLNDAMATKTDDDGKPLDDEAIVAKAQKRLDNLYAGILRTRGESEPADPFEAECYRQTKRAVEEALRAKGLFKDIPKGTKDRFMFVVNRQRVASGKPETDEASYIAEVLATPAGERIRKVARQVLKERAALGEMDVVA